MVFPRDFVWGAATSAYQAEGAWDKDGKGLSIWDVYSHREGTVFDGHNADKASDHYHRYAQDAGLMQKLSIPAYRLSISWPRVLPDGIGHENERGLDFYDRLVDTLLEAGVTPHVTFFHWDYPYELYKKGGWLNPDSHHWYAEYASVVIKRLSDRVRNWFTMNEPSVHLLWGHQAGKHAPGLMLGTQELLQVMHNLLLANGQAIIALKDHSKADYSVGPAFASHICVPAKDSDIDAAKRVMFERADFLNNAFWFDPLVKGEYPPQALALFDRYGIRQGREDMRIINQPVDFLGINIYSSVAVSDNEDGKPGTAPKIPGYPKMALENWAVVPEGLYWGPKFFYERYKKPIMITENGYAGCDWVALDGKVHDPQRIDYIHRYLNQFSRAIGEGVEGAGYFYWSVIDDFEWAWGYSERFGLIFVDFQTGERIIKDSGYWYKKVIETNGCCLSEQEKCHG